MTATPDGELTIQLEVDVRRTGDRFATKLSWLDSKHSFSFSRHWDPRNTHHGVLLVNNDDICAQAASICAAIAGQHCAAQHHQIAITPDVARPPSIAGRPTP
jgi:hypothetical protein